MKYDNGNEYEGSWLNDKQHGFGKLTMNDGSVLKGEWNG